MKALRSTSIVLVVLFAVQVTQPALAQTWRVLSHTMAKGIDISTGRPIGNTTSFLTTDDRAVCWFEIEIKGFGPLTLTWKWLEPSGALYREHSVVELTPRSGIYHFWDVLPIRNTPAEVKIGIWLVEIYVRTENLFRAHFTVEAPATSYSVQLTVTGFARKFFTSLYVDGAKVGTILGGETKELTFKIGTSHNLSVDKYVQGEVGVRFYCPANAISLSDESFHLFLYETEYYLKVVSEYGVSKGQGWHKAGSVADFSVSTPVAGQWGIQYVFKHWTGDVASSSAAAIILMDGPKEVRALWTTDYSQFYILVLIVAGAFAIIAATLLTAKRKQPAQPAAKESPPSAPDCSKCGRKTLYVERVKRYYCTECKKYL